MNFEELSKRLKGYQRYLSYMDRTSIKWDYMYGQYFFDEIQTAHVLIVKNELKDKIQELIPEGHFDNDKFFIPL